MGSKIGSQLSEGASWTRMKRKGGFIWLLIGLVAILIVIKLAIIKHEDDREEAIMHEVKGNNCYYILI